MLSEKQIKDNRLLKEEVLPHHRRMLEWAKQQPPNECSSDDKMKSAIGENYKCDDCAYCKEYCYSDCEVCPLYKKYGACNRSNYPKNKWWGLVKASTWGEWVQAGNAFIKQLERLEVKDKVRVSGMKEFFKIISKALLTFLKGAAKIVIGFLFGFGLPLLFIDAVNGFRTVASIPVWGVIVLIAYYVFIGWLLWIYYSFKNFTSWW